MDFNTEDIKEFSADKPKGKHIEAAEMAFLKNSVVRGNVEEGDLHIFILDEVYEHVQKYAKTDIKKELGGVFLGSYVQKEECEVLIINGVLDAKHTIQSDKTLEYTEKTWLAIHRETEAFYPDTQIVGWFHTCPGYGVFLSSNDPFLENNFSDFLWQVGLMIDPISEKQEWFQRKKGDIQKCSGYYLYSKTRTLTEEAFSERRKRVQQSQKTVEERSAEDIAEKKEVPVNIKVKKGSQRIHFILHGALFLLVFILLISQIQLSRNIKKIDAPAAPISDEMQISVMEELAFMQQKLQVMEEMLAQEQVQVPSAPNNGVDSGQPQDGGSQSPPTQDQKYEHVEYVIKEGETLWSISQRFYNDGQKYKMLMEVNNIDDLDKVQVGQKIIIPKE